MTKSEVVNLTKSKTVLQQYKKLERCRWGYQYISCLLHKDWPATIDPPLRLALVYFGQSKLDYGKILETIFAYRRKRACE